MNTVVYVLGLLASLTFAYCLGRSKTEKEQKEKLLDAVVKKKKLSRRVSPERVSRWVRK